MALKGQKLPENNAESVLEELHKSSGKDSSTEGRYKGWILDYSTGTAVLMVGEYKQNPVRVKLFQSSPGSLYQAWWPHKPLKDPRLAISGCCLWDGRWQIEFAPLGPKINQRPARRALTRHYEREDVCDRLSRGHSATRIYVPCGLGEYHKVLIKWQATQMSQMKITEAVYHIPTEEYHWYISMLETALGFKCPELHEKLDKFAEEVTKELLTQLGDYPLKLRFVNPMKEAGASNPIESYLQPYVRVKDLGTDPSLVIGLNDMVESRLNREASILSGITVPILGLVVGTPHPFHNKALQNGEWIMLNQIQH